MAKTILTAVLIVLLNVMVGCTGVDSGRSQLTPAHPGPAPVISMANAGETDLIEQVAMNRNAYRRGLEMLIRYYIRAGNNMKMEWAQKELKALEAMPQYNYISQVSVAGSNLEARTSISEADALYDEAFQIEKEAGPMPFLKDEKMLRMALNKYNELISKHPSSDKIDDAAFRAGGIHEYFKDYTLAVECYQRAYQWDRYTVHPAKYKAAYVLDRKLHQRAEALELYRQVVNEEFLAQSYREFAQMRIAELTKGEEGSE